MNSFAALFHLSSFENNDTGQVLHVRSHHGFPRHIFGTLCHLPMLPIGICKKSYSSQTFSCPPRILSTWFLTETIFTNPSTSSFLSLVPFVLKAWHTILSPEPCASRLHRRESLAHRSARRLSQKANPSQDVSYHIRPIFCRIPA